MERSAKTPFQCHAYKIVLFISIRSRFFNKYFYAFLVVARVSSFNWPARWTQKTLYKYWFISIDAWKTWSENDPLLYWPMINIQQEERQPIVHSTCMTFRLSIVHAIQIPPNLCVLFIFQKKNVIWFDLLGFIFGKQFLCHASHLVWFDFSGLNDVCVCAVVDWSAKKNVSSRHTLPTGYLTKPMDTYEARSIAHVSGAQPLLFATQNSGYILIIDINNIINLWLGCSNSKTLDAPMMQLISTFLTANRIDAVWMIWFKPFF